MKYLSIRWPTPVATALFLFLGLLGGCPSEPLPIDPDDAAVDIADTSVDGGMDISGDPGDVSMVDAGEDVDVSSDVLDVLDAPRGPCLVDERVSMNRCVPCSGGEARPAGDDPSGPDTECAPDECTSAFGISCNRFEGAYIKGSANESEGFMGVSVAVDGDLLAVSAPGEEEQAGAVYVFRRDADGQWNEEARLTASNRDAGDFFGNSVALDGGVLVVGAPYESSRYTFDPTNNEDFAAGAAYIYERRVSGDTVRWQESAYLKANPPVDQTYFGWEVALEGTTAVVGHPGCARRAGRGTGCVHVYERVGAVWEAQPLLQASNADIRDSFGDSVSLHGDGLIVGAPFEDGPLNGTPNVGAAYVFRRVADVWQEEAILRADIGDANDEFGTAVAIDGDTSVVSAGGEDSGDIAAPEDDSRIDSGAVYVFDAVGSEWSQSAYLKAETVRSEDDFGHVLALEGSTLAIGALREDGSGAGVNTPDDGGLVDVGAAYIFRRADARWTQSAYIHAPNIDASDIYGRAIALRGGELVVGAPQEDGSATTVDGPDDDLSLDSGAAYVHRIAP